MGAADFEALEWNARVVCYGQRVRMVPGASSCLSCRTPWLVLVRLLFLGVELAAPVALVSFTMRIPASMRHVSAFAIIGYDVAISWSVLSHPNWSSSPFVNFLSSLFLLPGSWLTPECLTSSEGGVYDVALFVYFVHLLTPFFSATIVSLLIAFIAARRIRAERNERDGPVGAFEALDRRRHIIDHELNSLCVIEELPPLLQLDASGVRITPHRPTRSPFTKHGLYETLIERFGPATDTAIDLLREYETIIARQIQLKASNRLFNFVPTMPEFTFASLLPLYVVIYMIYLPKQSLYLALALTCGRAKEPKPGRHVFSSDCGVVTSSPGKVISLKLMSAFLGFCFIFSVPMLIYVTMLRDIDHQLVMEAAGAGQRDPCVHEDAPSVPFADHLERPRMSLVDQTRSSAVRSVRRLISDTTITDTHMLICAGYKPGTTPGFVILYHCVKVLSSLMPLASNRSEIVPAFAFFVEVIVFTILRVKKPFTNQTFNLVSMCAVAVAYVSMFLFIFYEYLVWNTVKVAGAEWQLLVVRKGGSTTALLAALQLFICLQGIITVIFGAIVASYEYGKLVSYRFYRWRSKTAREDRSGAIAIQNWLFRFFFHTAQRYENRITFDPGTFDTRILRFATDSSKGTKRVKVNSFLMEIDRGLKCFCRGPYCCVFNSHITGLLTRFCLHYISYLRDKVAKSMLSLNLAILLMGLAGPDANELTREDDAPGEAEVAKDNFLKWFDEDVRNSFFMDRRAVDQISDLSRTSSEKRWHFLCIKRQAIKIATDYLEPTTFNYIEILESEFSLAVDHLMHITPSLSPELLVAFLTSLEVQLSNEFAIKELAASCDKLLTKLCRPPYSKAQLVKHFEESAKLAELKQDYKIVHGSCVTTQVTVLQNLARENEFKLLQAGYSSDILKELACIQNVTAEIERSKVPVDVLNFHTGETDEGELSDEDLQQRLVPTSTQILVAREEESEDNEYDMPLPVANLVITKEGTGAEPAADELAPAGTTVAEAQNTGLAGEAGAALSAQSFLQTPRSSLRNSGPPLLADPSGATQAPAVHESDQEVGPQDTGTWENLPSAHEPVDFRSSGLMRRRGARRSSAQDAYVPPSESEGGWISFLPSDKVSDVLVHTLESKPQQQSEDERSSESVPTIGDDQFRVWQEHSKYSN